MYRCIFSILLLAMVYPRDNEGAAGMMGQDSCAISRLQLSPAQLSSAQLGSAQGLTRETCQTRWKEKGESRADRVSKRGVSYVSPCLCPPPQISAGLDYPEFTTDQLWREHGHQHCQRDWVGGVSGQIFRPQPPGWTGGTSTCQRRSDIFINDAVFCFDFGAEMEAAPDTAWK